ncbi:hypothetical protein ACFLZQ_06970 [Thermodesulfobacteriota bacterium]
MKKIIEFLKTTIVGGLFVLLPVILIYLALAETLEILVLMATPIADLFFPGHFEESEFIVLIAIALLISLSFILGLIMLSDTGRRFGDWIERIILDKVPGYNAIKSLTKGFADSQQKSSFKPALLKSADGNKEFVYIVEDHGNGNLTVMVPWTPTPFAGSIKIVPKDHVEPLDVKMGKLTETLSQWGLGAKNLVMEKSVTPKPEK